MRMTYSIIDTFKQCPKKFYYRYIKKEEEILVGDSLLKGREFHKKLESGVIDESTKWCLEKVRGNRLKRKGNKISINWDHPYLELKEFKFAWDKDKKPCDYDSEGGIFRGKIDLVELEISKNLFLSQLANNKLDLDSTITSIQLTDWKTGKVHKKQGLQQLSYYSLFFFYSHPQIERIRIFLRNATEKKEHEKTILRSDMPSIESEMVIEINQIEEAIKQGTFTCKYTPLCSYCSFNAVCRGEKKEGEKSLLVETW